MSAEIETLAPNPRDVPDGIIVIGGGWAGLATAVELARQGRKPVVLEASRTLGGRARSIRVGADVSNNGNHLLLGAYRSVLATMQTIGVPEERVFRRMPLGLVLKSIFGTEVTLQTRALPAPLHLLWALLNMKGMNVETSASALRLLWRARRDRFDIRPDVALIYYLRNCGQPADVVRALWQPLCHATLATPIDRASTRLFLHVLRDIFFGRRAQSDFLVPTAPLVDCLPKPAAEYIESRGGSVRVGTRVLSLHVGNEGEITGVQLRGQMLPARQVVIATSADTAVPLLQMHPATAELAQKLSRIETYPINTLNLDYPPSVQLPRALVGVLDGSVQWLFDRSHLGEPRGRIAAVIGGPGSHTRLTNDALIQLMVSDIAKLFPHWPAPQSMRLTREKHATLAATPENEALRPRSHTPIKGLWLAGDYTAAGFPSSLEAAVRSGIVCARRVLREQQRRGM
jgi:squalene-associated FAD-dependent desaturase